MSYRGDLIESLIRDVKEAETEQLCAKCGHPLEWHCNIMWRASGCQGKDCKCDETGEDVND